MIIQIGSILNFDFNEIWFSFSNAFRAPVAKNLGFPDVFIAPITKNLSFPKVFIAPIAKNLGFPKVFIAPRHVAPLRRHRQWGALELVQRAQPGARLQEAQASSGAAVRGREVDGAGAL